MLKAGGKNTAKRRGEPPVEEALDIAHDPYREDDGQHGRSIVLDIAGNAEHIEGRYALCRYRSERRMEHDGAQKDAKHWRNTKFPCGSIADDYREEVEAGISNEG